MNKQDFTRRFATLFLIPVLAASTFAWVGDTCGLDLSEHPRRIAVRLTAATVQLDPQMLGDPKVNIESPHPYDPYLRVLEYSVDMDAAQRLQRVEALAALPTVSFATRTAPASSSFCATVADTSSTWSL